MLSRRLPSDGETDKERTVESVNRNSLRTELAYQEIVGPQRQGDTGNVEIQHHAGSEAIGVHGTAPYKFKTFERIPVQEGPAFPDR